MLHFILFVKLLKVGLVPTPPRRHPPRRPPPPAICTLPPHAQGKSGFATRGGGCNRKSKPTFVARSKNLAKHHAPCLVKVGYLKVGFLARCNAPPKTQTHFKFGQTHFGQTHFYRIPTLNARQEMSSSWVTSTAPTSKPGRSRVARSSA